MKFWNNLSLLWKLCCIAAFSTLCILAIEFQINGVFEYINKVEEQQDLQSKEVLLINEIEYSLAGLNGRFDELETRLRNRDDIKNTKEKSLYYVGVLEKALEDLSNLPQISETHEIRKEILDTCAQVMAPIKSILSETTYENFSKQFPQIDEKMEALDKQIPVLTNRVEKLGEELSLQNAAHRSSSKNTLIIEGGIAIFVTLMMTILIARGASGAIVSAVEAMKRLSQGDYDMHIERTDRRDEVGQLQNISYELRNAVEKSVTLQGILDRIQLPVMVADKNYNIIYVNDISSKVLRTIEHLLPVKVDNLVGSSIDIFHKNPSHQRGMLRDTAKMPHKAQFNIGSETLRLNANIITNTRGEFNGAFVDWNVVTAEVKAEENNRIAEEAISNIIMAVQKGDLTTRIEASGFTGFYKNLAEGINKLVDTVKDPIDKSLHILQELAKGSLTEKMDGHYEGAFANIQHSLNDTIQRLQETVLQIKGSATSVTHASSEISAGSSDLATRTEQQASSLEQTAASMEQLTQAVRKSTENCNEANRIASDTSTMAERGGEIVGTAVTAMSAIETSSKKVSDIVGVIDEIAFQINLLALNAAVEAARAGDAGKGFAVVASEVRALAGRSAAASKEIRELITASAEQVENGVRLVQESGQTLGEIIESVRRVASLISDVANASRDQSRGIEEVNAAVAQMDEMTQQNAALVEENSAAAQSLVDQSNNMMRMMSFFSVNDNGGKAHTAPAIKSHVPPQIKHGSHHKPSVNDASKVEKAQPKPQASAKAASKAEHSPKPEVKAAAPKPKKAASAGAESFESGWEEF